VLYYLRKFYDGCLTAFLQAQREPPASESAGDIRHFPQRTRFVPGIHIVPPHLGIVTYSYTSS
jgi:hypothetical protein